MSNQYQRYFEIQYSVKELINNFMQSNGVSSLEMEDALLHLLYELKDQNCKNFLIELQQNQQNNVIKEEFQEEEVE